MLENGILAMHDERYLVAMNHNSAHTARISVENLLRSVYNVSAT